MQLPHSPNFNALDLGFFQAIQSLQYKSAPRDMEELFNYTVASFDAYDLIKLENTFVTQQKCLELSMFNSGGNRYKLTRLGKDKSRNRSKPITTVVCDRAAYNPAHNLVSESQ